MSPLSQRSAPRGIATQLVRVGVGFAFAVALAVGAAHWYEPPRSAGRASGSLWLERDFLCSVASSGVALALAFWSRRAATGSAAIAGGSIFARVLIWAGLTLLFLGVWVEYIYLFALIIAPTHALACSRLLGLWGAWRADVAWQRER